MPKTEQFLLSCKSDKKKEKWSTALHGLLTSNPSLCELMRFPCQSWYEVYEVFYFILQNLVLICFLQRCDFYLEDLT